MGVALKSSRALSARANLMASVLSSIFQCFGLVAHQNGKNITASAEGIEVAAFTYSPHEGIEPQG